jgi:excisionase family DNA binding protein
MKRKRSIRRGSITFYWENPPGPKQKGFIERVVRGHVYTREIKPNGVLSPSEAALALEVRREFIYHLIWKGKIKAVKKKGQIAIPFSEVKAYDARRQRRPAPVRKSRR